MIGTHRPVPVGMADTRARAALVVGATVALLIAWLTWSGQPAWCACNRWNAASWDVWSSHNSQHVVDPYSASHFLHGLIFFALLSPLARRVRLPDRLAIAAVVESLWEVLENSPLIIQRYRESTVSLEYAGDSVANSVADVGWCLLGFAFAARFPVSVSIAVFTITELVLLALIRDNLTLNVIMLVWPIEGIRAWQAMGH